MLIKLNTLTSYFTLCIRYKNTSHSLDRREDHKITRERQSEEFLHDESKPLGPL